MSTGVVTMERAALAALRLLAALEEYRSGLAQTTAVKAGLAKAAGSIEQAIANEARELQRVLSL